jgi:hypothetical protein
LKGGQKAAKEPRLFPFESIPVGSPGSHFWLPLPSIGTALATQ